MKFINEEKVKEILKTSVNPTHEEIDEIIDKAEHHENLDLLDVAKLLEVKDDDQLERIKTIAGKMKETIYGKRVVLFAPFYISNYCVNQCVYCGYNMKNKFKRKRLTQKQIAQEVKTLESLGHKRLALEAGEDPINCSMDYILESMDTIYDTRNQNGNIRRINVNIAATTVENYKRLKEKGIGTYILFQETYHEDTYKKMHPKGPKSNYEYHLTAFDRAMEAGIDDVGAGVLFGLYDYKFEVLSLIMHNLYLEEKYGVGFHTISVPRLKKAEGVSLDLFPNLVDDEAFIRIVTVLRLALPFVGIILSTRETPKMRERLIKHGVSQISAGSCTEVGGYKEKYESKQTINQFELSDERAPLEVISQLVDSGYIPSYCTACYRSGRTGDRFMRLAKSGQIGNVCEPNALMTLMEYVEDYGSEVLKEKAKTFIHTRVQAIKNEKVRDYTIKALERIENNERDLFI